MENETIDYWLSPNKKQVRIEGNLASKWKRFFNFLLDIFFYLVFEGIVIIIFVFISMWIDEQEFETEFYSNLNIVMFLISIPLLFFAYFIFLEKRLGKTIGKMITKSRVVDQNGMKPHISLIIARTTCRLIPIDCFSFLTSKNHGWHDHLSNTRVVNDKPL